MGTQIHRAAAPGVGNTAGYAWSLLAGPSPWIVIGVAVFASYVAVCNLLRFRFERAMRRAFPYPDRASLAKMTNTDAQAILSYIIQREFPFMYKLALQFGIFKTYGVPSISRLVVATRSVTDPIISAKRYEDTVIIFAEFSLNPPTSDRCLKAIARMNYLHSKYMASGQISNADLLYTLAACVTEPIRFMARYEWRPMNDMERCAFGVFFMALGDAMGIEYAGFLARGGDRGWRDGLDFVDDLTAWARQYERDAMRPDPINVQPARRLTAMLLQLVPRWAQPFAVEALTVMMGEGMREAFHYPEPGVAACAVTYAALAARRFVLRYLMLPRRANYRATAEQPDPQTGRIQLREYLVHPWYNRPTVWNRWGPMALLMRAFGGAVPGDLRMAAQGKGVDAATKKGRPITGGSTYLPEGFLFEELGPFHTMGVGTDEVAAEVERLRKMRSTGCPFG